MDNQIRIILIIIVSVSIFGLLLFVFVKNYIRSKINSLIDKEKKLISGDTEKIKTVYDTWVFAKDINPSNLNWLLWYILLLL